MNFYGRDSELKAIKRCVQRDNLQAVLVYGRRRVGKSALIKQCLQDTDCLGIYYECKQTTEMNNVECLSDIAGAKLKLPPLRFTDFEQLFLFICQEAQDRPIILVLDEYPFLREQIKGLDSIIKSAIDSYREVSQLKLILCGSFVDVMKSLLMVENPLYGRIDLTIDLKPMDYYDAAMFYPDFSPEDKVRLYSVLGGIPYYNRLVDSNLSVRENIIELIASPMARLENEVSMYIRSEISRLNNANEAFEALAKGFCKFKDILSQSHVSSGPTLIDVLDKLIRMEVVKKEAPINDVNNRRRASYRIVDNLSAFYYRYVFRYMSQMAVLDPEVFYALYIDKDFEAYYVPERFEAICRQYLIRQNKSGRVEPPFTEIGKYYYDDPISRANGEFDVVTRDENGFIFYESKFRKRPVTDSMVKEEIRQVNAAGLDCYKYGFFSRSGFDVEPKGNLILINLKDMYL